MDTNGTMLDDGVLTEDCLTNVAFFDLARRVRLVDKKVQAKGQRTKAAPRLKS